MTSFSGVPHTGEIVRFGPRQVARALKADAFRKWPREKQRALSNWLYFRCQDPWIKWTQARRYR